jgi:hypothetical protein
MHDSALHELVQKLLTTGQLPIERAHSVHAAYGKGDACGACGRSMPSSAIVYAISVGTGELAKAVALHLACYEVWRTERDRLEQKRPPLAPTDAGPISR